MKFGLFGKSQGKSVAQKGALLNVYWARTSAGKFRRLVHLNTSSPELAFGGVFVIWHGGVRPEWVYAGASEHIGNALEGVLGDDNVTNYENNGGLFVSWAIMSPAESDGVMAHFGQTANFLVASPEMTQTTAQPTPVALPGT